MKTRILKILVPSVIGLGVVVLFASGIAHLIVRWYDPGTYSAYDSHKMVAYLGKRFGIRFPDNIKEVKAARSGQGWDRGSDFILKFNAQPADVNKFLETAVETRLYDYNSMQDDRFAPYEAAPEWWTKPIKKGKMGSMYVEVTRRKDDKSHIYVYIDTSHEKNNVVYLRGTYRDQLDR